MPRFFAFLRAINAGRRRAVRMQVLQQAFESLGFSGVATFLGSGNVVFETRAKDVRTLEKRIKRRLQQVLGFSVAVFIRTHPELKEIAALEPFEHSQIRGVELNIIFLGGNLANRSKARLMTLVTESAGFSIHGRQIYWWRRKKPGKIALFHRATREGAPPAVYDPQHEHHQEIGREMAVAPAGSELISSQGTLVGLAPHADAFTWDHLRGPDLVPRNGVHHQVWTYHHL